MVVRELKIQFVLIATKKHISSATDKEILTAMKNIYHEEMTRHQIRIMHPDNRAVASNFNTIPERKYGESNMADTKDCHHHLYHSLIPSENQHLNETRDRVNSQ